MKLKGQAAVEYLTTYAWAILAVSIVTGIAYTSVQSSCTRSFSDFYTDVMDVNGFGLSGDDFEFSVENTRYQQLDITKANLTIDGRSVVENINLKLNPGEESNITVSGFDTSSSCSTIEVTFWYDLGNLKDQKVNGIVRAPIRIDKS